MYAVISDIRALYGEAALLVADRSGEGVPDEAAVATALASASDEIDLHIGVRYELPLASPPNILRQLCIDIALYRLALDAAMLSEEARRRYEDARATLKSIGNGSARLPIATPPDTGGDTGSALPDTSPQPIVVSGPPRLFSRDKMRGF